MRKENWKYLALRYTEAARNMPLAADPAYADKLAEMKSELRNYLAQLPGGFGGLKNTVKNG